MYYNMNDIDVRSSNNFLRKVFLYILLGLHGKLLGINIAHKNKFKWAVIILAYIIFVGWSIQSEMSFILKLLVILIATYRFVVAINS